MEARALFINQYSRLRSGWRVVIFAIVYFALLFLLATVLRIVYVIALAAGFRPGEYVADLIFRITLLTAALLAGYICARFLEELPWRSLGISFHQKWLRHFLFGSIIGAASLALAAAIARIGGGLTFSLSGKDVVFLTIRTLIMAAVLFVIAALAEEATFRGYPLQTLTRAHLAWLGILLTSVPFAAIHLSNPNVVKGFTFANTAIAGLWLAVAYLRTRSLWFPLGIHWAWNWVMNSVLGLPVSGVTISRQPLFHAVDLGPAWLTGGSYGIEGGAACTITLILSTLFIWRTRFVSATPDMLELTSHENPSAPANVISIVPHVEEDHA